jgi:hypothetical protein
MRRSVMTGAVLTVGTVLGVLTVVTAADGRGGRADVTAWPLFGRPATLNTAAYCAPVSSISAGHHENRQVAGAHDTVYGSEGRAPRVPHEVLDRGLSRLVPDNAAGGATWFYARGPVRRGDLMGKRSSAKQVRRTFSSSSSSSRRGSTGRSSTGATRLCRNLCVRPFPCIPGNNRRGSNHYD